jgi:hypothetical protein
MLLVTRLGAIYEFQLNARLNINVQNARKLC